MRFVSVLLGVNDAEDSLPKTQRWWKQIIPRIRAEGLTLPCSEPHQAP